MTTAREPAPGWYDDGVTPGVQRWFDGRAWTEYTRPLPELALRRAAAATGVAAATAAGTTWVPDESAVAEPVAEPASEAWGAPATSWGGSGPSRFGTGAPAGYGGAGAVSRFGTPVGVGAASPGWGAGPYELRPVRPRGVPAHWGWRVLATTLDQLLTAAPYVLGVLYAGATAPAVDVQGYLVLAPTGAGARAVGVGALVTLVLWYVNRVVLQGRTGRSWGKRIIGLRTVRELDERPLGMWWALVRDVAHVVNGVPLYLGYLWPLWDARRQTFSDKLSSAVVLRDPR